MPEEIICLVIADGQRLHNQIHVGGKLGTFSDLIVSFKTWKGFLNSRELEGVRLITYAADASASPQ